MILKEIKEKIHFYDHKTIAKALGYNSIEKFESTLDKFLKTETLYDWLDNGNYDLCNDSKSFLDKITLFLDVDQYELKKELNKINVIKAEIVRFKDAYIFVNTNFKRRGESIWVLGLAGRSQRISLSESVELFFKSKSEIFETVSELIKEHYRQKNGELSILGKIISYQLHLFGETTVFEIDGSIREEQKLWIENKATKEVI